ncbi:MAG: hypothetical protein IT578_10945 [Verrucomicrobiae bacterium]|nr:hypothetical protein [Verrucomicrobiae bacterium]
MNALFLLSAGLGLLGLACGAWSLGRPEEARRFLRGLPRNLWLGRILFAADVIWAMVLLDRMDLGSLNAWKAIAFWASPAIYFYAIFRLDDYLGAQALALFLVLAAKPVLWICFLRDEPARLVLVFLAYAWAVAGGVFFCAPHWLRDLIALAEATPTRWKALARLKLAGGALLLLLAVAFF